MDNETNIIEPEGTEQNEIEQKGTKTFTEEDVLKLVESESSKRVNQALKKQAKEYEKKLSLSKLDEAERATAEKDMKIEELQAKLAQYEVEKNKSELKSVLSSRGLSAEFADLIQITDDLEESQARIDMLDRLFKQAVANEVKARLATGKPQVGTGDGANEITHERFKKMSLTERNQLYRDNRELYDKLKG